ncbi:TOMM precursor leader peptide-binding protein [Planomonospora sp. ID67723]|uniref:TOMM precursor leader peptide-binding protein n=1 Tax=Planomonospora sp. ID67723 TaxID=2738134 RepID=UPI0018C444B1|nr:TOMM precursor leader peptide-binding protein [Planomonospora sp. ID67723]MBG0829784.1 TOMM precursor leader peptide-binding protein [Planomonospora sp. ID67723]
MTHLDAYHRPVLVAGADPADIRKVLGDADDGLLKELVSLLDGSYSVSGVYGALLVSGFDVDRIFRALDGIDRAGLLRECGTSESRRLSGEELTRYASQMELFAGLRAEPLRASGSAWQATGADLQALLKDTTVVIVGLGAVGADLMRLLALTGIGTIVGAPAGGADPAPRRAEIVAELRRLNPFVDLELIDDGRELTDELFGFSPELVVYCPDEFEESAAETVNSLCLQRGTPYLFYRRRGVAVEVGPLVIPRETACYRCFTVRRRAALDGMGPMASAAGADRARPMIPLSTDWVAFEVVKFVTGIGEPVTRARMLAFDYMSGVVNAHPVLKLPRCPSCGVHRSRPSRTLWEERTRTTDERAG